MKNNNYLITGIIVVIVAAAAFFGGMQYQKTQTPAFGGGRFARGATGQNGQFGGRANGMRPVSGEILSVDATGITVKMTDGSSKIIILSDSTTINKASEGSKSDLKTGENVTVFGTTNSDGSVTAQNVSLGIGMMFQRGTNTTPTPSK